MEHEDAADPSGPDPPGQAADSDAALIGRSCSQPQAFAAIFVTRDQFIRGVGGPRGTWFREGQVLVSRAQLALAVVDAPCQRPGETTTCASYVETTWVGG